MKKIPILILTSFLFITCNKPCEDNDTLCTQAELSWLAYSGGEKLIFKRNDGVYDTIIVGNRVLYNNLIYPTEEGQCQHHIQMIRIEVCSQHFGYGVCAEILISHSNQWSGYIHPSIDFESGEFLNLDVSPQNNVIVNGNIYNNVYIIHVDTTNITGMEPWRIYYTKQNGIIREDLTEGKYWEKIN